VRVAADDDGEPATPLGEVVVEAGEAALRELVHFTPGTPFAVRAGVKLFF
jgi:hypothetical protein